MRAIKTLTAILASSLLVSACSAVETAERYVSEKSDGFSDGTAEWQGEAFDRIVLSGPDNLEFTTGGSHAVEATGDADVLEKLRFKVVDGELRIGRKKEGWSIGDSGAATIMVSAPALRALSIAGSGDADVDRMDADDVDLSIAGSGSVTVAEVRAASLKGSIAGSGTMVLAGKADKAKFSIAGSGDVKSPALEGDDVDIRIAGSGDVRIKSNGKVNAKLMGSGDVRIDGSAQCSSKSMGSGSLRCG